MRCISDINTVSLILLLLGCSIAVADDYNCTGEHEYVDAVTGQCEICEKCPHGQQPTSFCGYGLKSEEYSCETCPIGTFSVDSDYRRCMTCKPCGRWNAEIVRECTEISDRECGACNKGYFRPMKSDGTRDEECHLCGGFDGGERACDTGEEEESDIFPRFLGVIVGVSVFVSIVIVVFAVLCRRCWRRGKKNAAADPEKDDLERHNHSDEVTRRVFDPELCERGLSSVDSQTTRAEEISTLLLYKSGDDGKQGWAVDPTAAPTLPMASTQNSLTYSNRPTIPCESREDHRPKSGSNKKRKQSKHGATSSSESLLEHQDRDSRDIGGQSLQVTLDTVEFFDTESVQNVAQF